MILHNQEYLHDKIDDKRKTVLVVEPDDGVAAFLCTIIQEILCYSALRATNSAEALALAQEAKLDLFLLAGRTTPLNSIDLYDRLHAMAGLETVSAIILSADLPCYQEAIAQRHLTGISEPFEIGTLLTAIADQLASSSQKPARTLIRIESRQK